MNTKPDEQETREAGSQYGAMAADLSLVHISLAETEEAIQEHIANLARNVREQAEQLSPQHGGPVVEQGRHVASTTWVAVIREDADSRTGRQQVAPSHTTG